MISYILRKMDCPFYAKVKSDNYNEAKKRLQNHIYHHALQRSDVPCCLATPPN